MSLPGNGICLKKTKCNFPPANLILHKAHEDAWAQFAAGSICVCNENTIACRESWNDAFGLQNDGPPRSGIYIDEEGEDHGTMQRASTKKKNFGIFINVDSNGLHMANNGIGQIWDQHLEPISDVEMIKMCTIWKPMLTKWFGNQQVQENFQEAFSIAAQQLSGSGAASSSASGMHGAAPVLKFAPGFQQSQVPPHFQTQTPSWQWNVDPSFNSPPKAHGQKQQLVPIAMTPGAMGQQQKLEEQNLQLASLKLQLQEQLQQQQLQQQQLQLMQNQLAGQNQQHEHF